MPRVVAAVHHLEAALDEEAAVAVLADPSAVVAVDPLGVLVAPLAVVAAEAAPLEEAGRTQPD